MSSVRTSKYQQYRAPKEDGSYLVQPCRTELLETLSQASRGRGHYNAEGAGLLEDTGLLEHTGHSEHTVEFCGKSLKVVRQQAQEEVLQCALDFTQNYCDVSSLGELARTDSRPPLILSGHQPELFHPGVWFKNFLLSELATQAGAIGINFLVDNDLCRSTSIRVPALDSFAHRHSEAQFEQAISPDVVARSVLFDAPHAAIPWEVRTLGSIDVWRDFPRAVQQALLPGLRTPLLADTWPDAVEAIRRTERPGLALAEMRHKLENRIGLRTLEVPLSRLVSTRAFARFSIQLLSELPRFQETYNRQLERYRTAHRIRSHAHPVPALAQVDDWLEAPWWVYQQTKPQRQPLWVRVRDDQLILSDRAGWQATITGRLDCDNASTQWLKLLAEGICIRPRALLTTMYLRLIVSDLFVHGIGGGKYDQLTDAIVHDFFGLEPAPMAVATATLHLPLGENFPAETGHELADLAIQGSAERERLWQLKYHAEQLLTHDASEPRKTVSGADDGDDSGQQQLSDRKRELLANIPPRGEKWRWHREMTHINRRLGELASGLAERSKARLQDIAQRERQQRILQSREMSFCLFPLEAIAPRLKSMAEHAE